MRLAAKTVVKLLARADRKRRRLLSVEWAKANQIRAGLTQFHMSADDVSDIDPRE